MGVMRICLAKDIPELLYHRWIVLDLERRKGSVRSAQSVRGNCGRTRHNTRIDLSRPSVVFPRPENRAGTGHLRRRPRGRPNGTLVRRETQRLTLYEFSAFSANFEGRQLDLSRPHFQRIYLSV